ncbi:hypothetical protein [Actinomadura rupiterrae]|uniref:hypothetical protein n=1 Tax=Actinomadura rupiterrae TaxID=559627 RepID=UPI0020A4F535|nr:hypothetical protein [Actinomadura rupiterrae]MCP2340174.1 hypothetical protein [Actinomadura rupiterrae]
MSESYPRQVTRLADRALRLAADIDAVALVLDDAPDEHSRTTRRVCHGHAVTAGQTGTTTVTRLNTAQP